MSARERGPFFGNRISVSRGELGDSAETFREGVPRALYYSVGAGGHTPPGACVVRRISANVTVNGPLAESDQTGSTRVMFAPAPAKH